MQKGELGEPIGAIWVKDFKLRDSLSEFINNLKPICENCHQLIHLEIDEPGFKKAIKPNVLHVKIRQVQVPPSESGLDKTFKTGENVKVREKFIAIENTRKKTSTQPDYFLHIYQTHTGAAVSNPFGAKETTTQVRYDSKGQPFKTEGYA